MEKKINPRRLEKGIALIGSMLLMLGSFSQAEAPPEPWISIIPVAGPTLQILEEQTLNALRALEAAERMRFFTAIAENDETVVNAMLNAGMDANATLPQPVPREFANRFQDENVQYYVRSEGGFTALMLATVLNNAPLVQRLLQAGADPWKLTKRHKTFALWLAGKNGNIDIMRSLMRIAPDSEAMRLRIRVDVANQRAFLWRDNEVIFTTEVSCGRPSHPTPKGRYLVTDKYRMWKSTLYPAKMPYYLRLSCGDFGLHSGYVPGYAASHGCIRLPEAAAKKFYAEVPAGTLVEIE